ncbi:(Fe-S)-binding protein [Deltaproteobacteria bacterium Smac51]|nr:(Fe-S)-binding protein [Deltaproteobacteria bacterium Smac51]
MTLRDSIIDFINSKTKQANELDYYRQPLVGFSSAADPLYVNIKETVGPHHLYPQDVLAEVRTLVSFFIPFSQKVIEANRQDKSVPAREWVDSYDHANNLIDAISRELVTELEAGGVKAGTVNSTNNYDEINLRAPWSHRSAAFVAGLGRFGLNRMLITPAGAAGRYGTVFLGAELTPTQRSDEELCLFFKNGTCRYCLKRCPAKAIGQGPDGFARHECNKKLLDITPYSLSLKWELDVCGKCDVGPCAIF